MRLSRQQLADNEAKIRAAMTRLLNGDIPPGGKCDVKTLAGNSRRRPHRLLRQPPLRPPAHRVRAAAQGAPRRRRTARPPRRPGRPAQRRDHPAERTSLRVRRHDQRAHRIPQPGTGPAHRPAQRDHPAAPGSPAGRRRPPAASPSPRGTAPAMITIQPREPGPRCAPSAPGGMTCVTPRSGNRHTADHHQHETSAPESTNQNRYTNHLHTASADRRHFFATEAILNGMPPHIAQLILGHQDINTTMGYKAIYPQETINGHRAFIARRRASRPSEEYRTPTDAEWAEFLGLERRKVALGDCGRAYGTNCPHEHSCVRCPSSGIDPGQRPRLTDIRDNLTARITEADARAGSARPRACGSASPPPRTNWPGSTRGHVAPRPSTSASRPTETSPPAPLPCPGSSHDTA